jgi:hypothetical protein
MTGTRCRDNYKRQVINAVHCHFWQIEGLGACEVRPAACSSVEDPGQVEVQR